MAKMIVIAAQHQRPAEVPPPPQSGLSLKNDRSLDLTFIGTGSAFSKRFFQNNILVVKGDRHVLVDCGTRTPEALTQLGLSVTDIDTYLITHTHADHIGGLEEVMLSHRYSLHKKPRMIITDKLKHILWSMSLRGGAAYNEVKDGVPLAFDDLWETALPKRVRNADRELAVFNEGELEIRLFRTKHIPDSAVSWEDSFPSYGLLLDRRVLFTSDTRYDPDLILDLEAEYGLETIFHDCQFFRGGVHASLEELSALPAQIKAKTLLMHYGDGVDAQRAKAADAGFAGFVEQWATYRFEADRRPS